MTLADELERLGKEAPAKAVQGFKWRYRSETNKQSDVYAENVGMVATFTNEEDALAKRFGVCKRTVGRIIKRQSYV